jgi:polysaccharide biosynthesis protein PelE
VSEGGTFANRARVAVLTMLAAACESAILYCWLNRELPVWMALAAHAGVVAGVALGTCPPFRPPEDIRLPLLAAVSTAALGPFGALGTLVTLLLARHYMRSALPFEDWYQSLFPDTGETPNRKIVDQIARAGHQDAERVTAFSDILSFGSLQQKQDLIALVSRDFRPAFGPVLKRALTDGHSVIRVQAATAMSKLENTILARTIELTRQVRANPGDTEALRFLAQHYDDCLFCGILDPRREEELLTEALAVYRECLAREPGDLATQLAAGRLLLRGRRYPEAAGCFRQVAGPDAAKPQAALWYMESLFQLGKFEEIRRLARQWASHKAPPGGYPPEAVEAVRLWAGAAPDSSVIPAEAS